MPRPRRHEGARDRLRVAPDRATAAAREQLDERLRDRSTIDQAVGMLMAYHGVSAATAAAALRQWADSAELPLVHMATGVVEAGSQPSIHPFGTLRRILRDYALDVDSTGEPDHV